jgi:hypothetical protein
MECAAMSCYSDGTPQGLSRDQVPLLDKAIKLTWTLREQPQYAFNHLLLAGKRGAIEGCHGVGEADNQRVSDILLRALRRLRWPSRRSGEYPFHQLAFQTLMKLHGLGVHEEAAEQLIRDRFHDIETWRAPHGWAALRLSAWMATLLSAARRSAARREALVGQAKEMAPRAIPLLGGPWGKYATDHTCEVRLGDALLGSRV